MPIKFPLIALLSHYKCSVLDDQIIDLMEKFILKEPLLCENGDDTKYYADKAKLKKIRYCAYMLDHFCSLSSLDPKKISYKNYTVKSLIRLI